MPLPFLYRTRIQRGGNAVGRISRMDTDVRRGSAPLYMYMYTLLLLSAATAAGAQRLAENMVEYTIVEEQPVNTLIGNIVRDAQLDTRYPAATLQRFTYQFLSPTPTQEAYFEIEERTGLLRTAQSIDRDQICANSVSCEVRLDISVKPVEYFQIIKVTIRVRDINDNWPTFPDDRITLFMSETTMPGATFAIASAEDFDSGAYGIQGYRLNPGFGSENFGLKVTNNTDGSIDVHVVLKSRLDRENTDFYSLRVVAWDGGIPQKSGSVLVDIHVMDANDNNPRFTNSTYEISIFENQASGSTIATVRATDADDGDNAEITYSFNRNSENQYGHLFGIRHTTGEVYLKSEVSHEEGDTYHIGLVANDQGPNSLAAYAKLVVHVWDVNDHAPQISVNSLTSSGHAEISENAAVGSFVAHISVADPDSGRNGEFSCTIGLTLDGERFQLMQLYDTEYKVVTAATFDREVMDEYHMNLVCRDRGSTPQTATEHVTVRIIDENDHTPRFPSQSYTVVVPENNALGAPIIKLNVSDGDVGENARVQWSIHSVNGRSGSMDINRDTGRVTANVVLDHERYEEYLYVVVAADSGRPARSATATLTIRVQDVNDERPRFPQKAYTFGTFENQPANTEIGIVTAYDADGPPFNEVTYMFDPSLGADAAAFTLHPLTGKITARKTLDREAKYEYRLVVVAKNYGYSLSSAVNVSVRVADRNDNAPRISFPSAENHTVEVVSVARRGDVVTKVRAIDLDVGTNAAITYSLAVGNEEELFAINPRTGSVTVNKGLRERGDQTVHVTVLAQDAGDPKLSSIADLDIFVNGSAAAAHIYGSPAINDNLIIIITATLFAIILVAGVLILLLLLRRRRERLRQQQKYNCRVEATKVMMAASEEKKNAATLKNNLNNKDTGKGTLRKEVTLGRDSMRKNGFNTNPAWPSVLDPTFMQNPHAHSSSIHRSSLPRSQVVGGSVPKNNTAGPARAAHLPPMKDCRFREEPRHSLLYTTPTPTPGDQRKMSPRDGNLTEMHLQVHDMLQMMQQDQNSDRGSLTDSGRGASEEGDGTSRPSPVEKPGGAGWPRRVCSTFLPGDKHAGPGRVVKVNPRCPKHGTLPNNASQSASGSFRLPPKQCAANIDATNCNPAALAVSDTRREYPCAQDWAGPESTSDPHSYPSLPSRGLAPERRYLSPDDLLPPREAESVDGMSDSGTTTSGSYVVDMADVEESDLGPQISADIIV